MADRKVRQVEHDFSGRPLWPYRELSVEDVDMDEIADTTEYATKDDRWAGQAGDGRFFLVDKPETSSPIN